MYAELLKYSPVNEQEKIDKHAIIQFLERNPDAYNRSNLIGHMTSSAIVMNQSMDKVLFAHHNIYNSWGWVGGHNDGDHDCLHVAIKEAKEETGVKNIYPYNDNILGIDIIFVQNHIKNGIYVGDHLHLNVTYLLIADEEDKLEISHHENSDVKWFELDKVLDFVNEDRMKPIYQKLFDNAMQLKKN
ncbi:MAG: NUDIX domain-containing protein [Bacilli bacterium]|nr:NUDIX domain-containing protein [Bacilli bacterium]